MFGGVRWLRYAYIQLQYRSTGKHGASSVYIKTMQVDKFTITNNLVVVLHFYTLSILCFCITFRTFVLLERLRFRARVPSVR